ncbi:unnamed protein product [Hermetia illucens]|uniref:Uncharacterized protein n=1 Tax=Hermetia illucens TaxID=343691 RepID=A0A7R8ULY3_HERIL|nr:unnamed protein product [Hermetia illucens]
MITNCTFQVTSEEAKQGLRSYGEMRLGRYNNFPRLLALGGETCSNALEACTVVSGLLGSTARYRGWRGTGRTNGKTNRLHVRLLCDAPVVHNLIIPGRAVDILLFLGYNEWNSLTKRSPFSRFCKSARSKCKARL